MSEWFSGRELLAHWRIKELLLFQYVIRGLQPYNKLGQPIPPFNISKKLETLKGLERELKGLQRNCERPFDRRPVIGYRQKQMAEESKRKIPDVEERIQNLREDLPRNNTNSWEHFVAGSDEEVIRLINVVRDYLFKEAEVFEFERKLGLRPADKDTEITEEVIELMKKVRPEIEKVYEAIKAVGFSSNVTDAEEKVATSGLKNIPAKKGRVRNHRRGRSSRWRPICFGR